MNLSIDNIVFVNEFIINNQIIIFIISHWLIEFALNFCLLTKWLIEFAYQMINWVLGKNYKNNTEMSVNKILKKRRQELEMNMGVKSSAL